MNKKKIILTVIMIVLVILSFFSGNTFAKYLTTKKTTGSFEVAKWSVTEDFLVNGVSSNTSTVSLAKTYEPTSLVNGKMAPGTSGEFSIIIDTTGTETGIDFIVTIDNFKGSAIDNLVFTCNNKPCTDFTTKSIVASGNIITEPNGCNEIITLDFGWSWPYETLDGNSSKIGDEKDTYIGENLSNYSFDVTITCTQTTPKEIQNS